MNDTRFLRASRAVTLCVLLGACMLAGPAADARADPAATAPPPPAAAREFSRRLARAGRAEASLTRRFQDPLRGGQVVMHGRLALEPPDRARIDFDETGERVTLRADGGEWLQPQLEQMLRFGQAGAMGALRWWTLFGGVTGAGVSERRIGPREWMITMPASGVAGDSARVELDAVGLPHRIVIVEEAGAPVEYRLEGWRFTKPRGRPAFVIQAPPGYEVFDLQ